MVMMANTMRLGLRAQYPNSTQRGYGEARQPQGGITVATRQTPSRPGTFGERVRDLRKGFGLTQERLATKAGLKQVTISAIEVGRMNDLEGERLIKLCRALKTNADWLLHGSKAAHTPRQLMHLDDEEHGLIALFRELSKQQRQSLLEYAQFLRAQGKPSIAHPYPSARVAAKQT